MATPWAAESVISDYGVAPDKVHVVGIGRNHTATAGGRKWSEPRFLFIGMDWSHKNGPSVLEAFARLRDDIPHARLDVVGDHPSLDQYGVTGHGVLRRDLPKHRERVERLLACATCFVMPSRTEAAGIAYVEAAAAGLPSIGTSSGGSSYLIGDGGVTVDPSDRDDLLAAMRRLADPETAALMGAAAKRRSQLFTWTAVAHRVLRALEGSPAEPIDAQPQPIGWARGELEKAERGGAVL